MILNDRQIREELKHGRIVIDKFEDACLGPNSYDVHLAKTLVTYDVSVLDCRRYNATDELELPDAGYILVPGTIYLAATAEYTETFAAVPYLDGKSSMGRLGISIHITAGRGDVGFCGHWTMEIHVIQPVKVYPGMPVGQLTYHETASGIERPYATRGKYHRAGRQDTPKPMASQMWRNFLESERTPSGNLEKP